MKCIIEGCKNEAGVRGLCNSCLIQARRYVENGGSWEAMERAGLALTKGVRSANEGERSPFEVALSRMLAEGDRCFASNPSVVSQIVRAIHTTAEDGIAFDRLQQQLKHEGKQKLAVILNKLAQDSVVVECCNDRGQRVLMSKKCFDVLKERRRKKAAERKAESDAIAEAMRREVARNIAAASPDPEPAGLDFWLEDADPKVKPLTPESAGRLAKTERAILDVMSECDASHAIPLSVIKHRAKTCYWSDVLMVMGRLMHRGAVKYRFADNRECFFLTEHYRLPEAA